MYDFKSFLIFMTSFVGGFSLLLWVLFWSGDKYKEQQKRRADREAVILAAEQKAWEIEADRSWAELQEYRKKKDAQKGKPVQKAVPKKAAPKSSYDTSAEQMRIVQSAAACGGNCK